MLWCFSLLFLLLPELRADGQLEPEKPIAFPAQSSPDFEKEMELQLARIRAMETATERDWNPTGEAKNTRRKYRRLFEAARLISYYDRARNHQSGPTPNTRYQKEFEILSEELTRAFDFSKDQNGAKLDAAAREMKVMATSDEEGFIYLGRAIGALASNVKRRATILDFLTALKTANLDQSRGVATGVLYLGAGASKGLGIDPKSLDFRSALGSQLAEVAAQQSESLTATMKILLSEVESSKSRERQAHLTDLIAGLVEIMPPSKLSRELRDFLKLTLVPALESKLPDPLDDLKPYRSVIRMLHSQGSKHPSVVHEIADWQQPGHTDTRGEILRGGVLAEFYDKRNRLESQGDSCRGLRELAQ